jgi:hypothetical protein
MKTSLSGLDAFADFHGHWNALVNVVVGHEADHL